MALRMHPLTAQRWEHLAQSRLPMIDLTETAEVRHRPGGKRQAEHERIQDFVDALASRPTAVSR
jgi:hypothetical protein